MRMTRATVMVFGTSAAVLVLEIIAGRLMAPYVGISLETFTGIIGTVLAGHRGRLGASVACIADRCDPRMLIGPALIVGGALTWLSLPIVTGLGPHVGNGPVAIVILTSAAFFFPVAVLSAVSPMVAKLRLASLDETGTVVGGLSAAGTAGALAGTFITGFVLVAAIPSRTIVIVVGAVLVAAGIVATWLAAPAPAGRWPASGSSCWWSWSGVNVASRRRQPCEHETAYFCVRVEVSPANPTARNLYLDRLRHAYVEPRGPDRARHPLHPALRRRRRADCPTVRSTCCTSAAVASASPATSPRCDPARRTGCSRSTASSCKIAKDELGLVEIEGPAGRRR